MPVSVLNQTLNATYGIRISPATDTSSSPQQQSTHHDLDKTLRLNQIQVIGTHNSYHREVSLPERAIFPEIMRAVDPEAENYYYSHASVTDQLEEQRVRSFEFDVYADSRGGLFADPLIRRRANFSDDDEKKHYDLPAETMRRPGTKVLHVADADVGTICHTLEQCLREVRAWSRSRRGRHVPIPILLEFKMTEAGMEDAGGAKAEPWTTEALDRVDAEIRSVFGADELITPDDIRRQAQDASGKVKMTLEEAVLAFDRGGGWPNLRSSRGKVFFVMDNEPTHPIQIRDPYRAGGRTNLEGRVIFTNSVPGEPDAAFIKRNDPLSGDNRKQIQDLVSRGYFVRTRADEPIQTILRNETDAREAALVSGAQIVSTDWPAVGMASRYNSDYAVMLPARRVARCNPVNAPKGCDDDVLESAT